MTNLITEARELYDGWAAYDIMRHGGGQGAKSDDGEAERKFMLWIADEFPAMCDALENANEQNKQLMHELCKLACESVEREKTLARLEAEVMSVLHDAQERETGCDYCLTTWPNHAGGLSGIWHGNKLSVGYGIYREIRHCPMCGKRLEEHHEDD